MNKTLKNVLIFVGGLVTGGVTVGLIVHSKDKKKYEKEVQTVIDEFAQMDGCRYEDYKNKNSQNAESTEEPKSEEKSDEEKKKEYDKLLNHYHEAVDEPFEIDNNEMGITGNPQRLIQYYADGIAVFEKEDEPLTVEEVERFIGLDNLAQLGESNTDSIYIRCPATCSDYEVEYIDRPYYPSKEADDSA